MMATYSRSGRIKRAYRDCNGIYFGIGPAIDDDPLRFRVRCGQPRGEWHKLMMVLTVVKVRRRHVRAWIRLQRGAR